MMNEHQRAIREDQERLAEDHAVVAMSKIEFYCHLAATCLNAAHRIATNENARTNLEWALNYIDLAKNSLAAEAEG